MRNARSKPIPHATLGRGKCRNEAKSSVGKLGDLQNEKPAIIVTAGPQQAATTRPRGRFWLKSAEKRLCKSMETQLLFARSK
jgi:hypothetical protein